MKNRMTVKEVAAILGTAESTIRNKAADLFPECIKNGVATMLTESQVTEIKKNIVPRDLTLKSKVDSAVTNIEMQQKALEVMQWLYAQVESLTPKAQLADRMMNTGNLRTITDYGKIIARPRKIFTDLIASGVLFRRDGVLLPYQKYIDCGYFIVRYNLVKIGDHEERRPQTYITAAGEQWLSTSLYAPRLPL